MIVARLIGRTLLLVMTVALSITAQTGGGYDLSHSVIASGGGSNSTGSTFSVDGTSGQAMAGVQSSNSSFSLRGGFWMYQSLAPTAAGTSISGRIITPDGHGIRNARLVLTRFSNGEIRTALSASFGFYRFEDLPVGETYLLNISAKRYTFDSDTRIIHLLDELTDVDFIAGPAQ